MMRASDFTIAMRAALRAASDMEIPAGYVEACIDSGVVRAASVEADFATAYQSSLASIDRSRRGRLSPVTGHIAESVAALLLAESGWTPLVQFVEPMSGGHGIDLALMSPEGERVFVVEVKGTLSDGGWPRLSRGELDQMTPEWLDKPDNPGTQGQDLRAAEVSALVVLIHLHQRRWKAAISIDFGMVHPITSIEQLDDLSWLD